MRRALIVGMLLAASSSGVACTALDPTFGALVVGTDAGAPPDAGVSFERDLRPLLDRVPADPSGHGCKKCHYSTEPEHVGLDLGGLDLATLGSLRKGGLTSGASVVVPGHPDESAIVQKLRGTYPFGERMPRDGPPHWTEAEIELMSAWIAAGAKGADGE